MYKSVKRISFLRGINYDNVIFSPGGWNWSQILRNSSGLKEDKAETLKEEPGEISFANFMQQRQEQARRSVVIQISELGQWTHLIHLCSTFGNINKVYHYELNYSNFFLVEMVSEEGLENLIKSSADRQSFNNCKHFLHYFNKKEKQKQNLSPELLEKISLKTRTKVNYELILKKELKKNLPLSIQLQNLYDTMKVSDLGMRLRFLTCQQIQQLVSGILPNCIVYPFGSSISGFGIDGCDLDLVIIPGNLDNVNQFCNTVGRSVIQSHLVALSSLFNGFLMGSKDVYCIKNATVPIIKFKQTLFGLDCDLSLYNLHGVETAQMLCILSSINACVKPLVFVLKLWAKHNGLVNKNPGPSISNFSLTLLILFFLQQNKYYSTPVLPPWNVFSESNNFLLSDEEVALHLVNYKQKLGTENFCLSKLFYNFFKFYEDFDFRNNGISVRSGRIIENILQAPLYIENPLIHTLNVSKNVSYVEVIRFKEFCAVASDMFVNQTVLETPNFCEVFDPNKYQFKMKKSLKNSIKVQNIFEKT